MKPRLLTTATWLAFVWAALVLDGSNLSAALPTVDLVTDIPKSNGSSSMQDDVLNEPEIPYEELEEPRVLPLQALPVTVQVSTESIGSAVNENQHHYLQPLSLASNAVPLLHSDSNSILKVILEEPESNDEPFTTTHGYPTFSADDNIGNLLL